jgi:hypothetical protein
MILKDIKECYNSLNDVGDSKIVVVVATLLAVVIVIPLANLYWWVDRRRELREAKKEQ